MSLLISFYRHPRYRNLVAATHDAFMAGASYLLATYMRLGTDIFAYFSGALGWQTAIFTAIAVSVFISLRLYRGLWRFASTQDLIALTKAVTIALFLFYMAVFLFNRLEGIPRSVPFIHWLLLLAMLGAPRFAYRVLKDHVLGREFAYLNDNRIKVLIIGANPNTEHFLRETERNPRAIYRAVAILDANTRFDGQVMYGVPIYSGLTTLKVVLDKLRRREDKPQRIIVADDTLDGTAMRTLLDIANAEGISLARLPKLTEFKSGIGEGNEIRPIAVEDLLGRPQTAHNVSAMREMISGRRVLVTGAGGTIGSELVRQIASFFPASLTLVEQSEFNLYQIDQELCEQYPDLPRFPHIADVRDADNTEHIFALRQPDVVFHAAAIKHVPLAEANIEEAILTNMFGTKHIADACARHQVQAMVLISTDKAVNPANVMGATKRLAESYCQSLGNDQAARGSTRFITVRFGNVLGSTGSVVPLFEKQLKRGGPLTVTHPDMLRYFMTVREAVALVLQAAAMGAQPEESRHGLIFVVDMGQPVRIEELAIQMIRLAGLKPHEDIRIEYTGLRPGEKLFEELFHGGEASLQTEHEGILLAASRKVTLAELTTPLADLLRHCGARDAESAYTLLTSLVPEYAGRRLTAADPDPTE